MDARKGFSTDVEAATRENTNYRRVLYTAPHCQLVLMSLLPGDEIGEETHASSDQFLRFESGQGRVVINGHAHMVGDGSAVVVPAGARHNVINDSPTEPLKLYTVYAPPHHRDGVVAKTKAEAEATPEHFGGHLSESPPQ